MRRRLEAGCLKFSLEQIENQGVMHWDRKWRVKKRGFGEKNAKFRNGHVGSGGA